MASVSASIMSEVVGRAASVSRMVEREPVSAATMGASTPRVTAIIPAFNEASTVGGVVDAVKGASLVDRIIVVDNASRDATAAVALAHGAEVVHMPIAGKGQAMAAGVASTASEILLFLDSDLLDLTPAHVDSLVAPLLDGTADMTRGTIDRGRTINSLTGKFLPKITGQRGVRRELFESLSQYEVKGWSVEESLNAKARNTGARVTDSVLTGVTQRTKEQKLGVVEGMRAKVKMLATTQKASVQARIIHALDPAGDLGRNAVVDARAAITNVSPR